MLAGLPFLFLHLVSLCWLTRMLQMWKHVSTKRVVGIKTLKRMQRCAPAVLRRQQRQQLHYAQFEESTIGGIQSSVFVWLSYYVATWCTQSFRNTDRSNIIFAMFFR